MTGREKKRLKKRAEKEAQRKVIRKEKWKKRMELRERNLGVARAIKARVSILASIKMAIEEDKKNGNDPKTLYVPASQYEQIIFMKDEDGKVSGLDVEVWDKEFHGEIIKKEKIDVEKDMYIG